MVHCTETEQSDSNEADRGSELSDNDESQRREVTQLPAATKNHVDKGMLSLAELLYFYLYVVAVSGTVNMAEGAGC